MADFEPEAQVIHEGEEEEEQQESARPTDPMDESPQMVEETKQEVQESPNMSKA